jgi:hypothetical protein
MTTPTTAATDHEKDINDLMFGNMTPVWAFPEEGNLELKGRIVAIGKNHRRAFDGKTKTQGEPLYWQPNGKTATDPTDRPVYDPVLTLQTAFRAWEGVRPTAQGDDGDDDGLRRLFVTARSKSNPGSVKDALVAACVKAKSKVHIGDFVAMRRTGGRGNINSPFTHEADYFTAAKPPKWASEIKEEVKADADGDDLFG